ncbi:hypothetical protein B0H34DRAFT_799606 [Crassisporium funariophilum]|nr:hypothetical protein B0H34DRAFT_799606 [Crassisporium funariophilum]
MVFDTLASQASFAIYVHVGSLSVIVWDSLHNLRNDYRLLFHHRITFPTIAYFVSRITGFGYILARTIYLTIDSNNCVRFEDALIVLGCTFVAANTLLSYLRVCAVWNWNKVIVGIFGLLYLASVGGGLTITKGIRGAQFPGTDFCFDIVEGNYISAALFILLVNDTAVFLAITYGVSSMLQDTTIKGGIQRAFFGKSLPAFSKALLQDSQFSYFITVLSNAATVAWFYTSTPDPHSAFRLVLVATYIVSVNIMFCRVFRNTKLGFIQTTAISRQYPMSGMSESARTKEQQGTAASDETDINASSDRVGVSVKRVVEYNHDFSEVESKSPKKVEVLNFNMV